MKVLAFQSHRMVKYILRRISADAPEHYLASCFAISYESVFVKYDNGYAGKYSEAFIS